MAIFLGDDSTMMIQKEGGVWMFSIIFLLINIEKWREREKVFTFNFYVFILFFFSQIVQWTKKQNNVGKCVQGRKKVGCGKNG
jgi:hypothetical protein